MGRERTLRKIGVVGDVHCEDERLAAALQHFAMLQVDVTMAVGDMVDGEGDANRTCKLLADAGVLAVAGNHDRWFLEGRFRELPGATSPSALNASSYSWLQSLPRQRSFQTPEGRLMVCHGMGDDDMNHIYPDSEGYELESNSALSRMLKEGKYRFVINGHTHKPMVRSIQGLTIINGGSLCSRERPVCSLVDFDEGSVQFFDVNPEEIIKAEQVIL